MCEHSRVRARYETYTLEEDRDNEGVHWLYIRYNREDSISHQAPRCRRDSGGIDLQ